jgi:hypothetical protein
VKVGGEFTRYTIKAYSHFLDDQIFAEAYIERPIRWNAFIEDRLDLGDLVLVGGLRYDYFHTRAFRPASFPAISRVGSGPSAPRRPSTGKPKPAYRASGVVSPNKALKSRHALGT